MRSQISRNRSWVTMSAPVSDRTQPAPPKWSGWLWVTTTVCTRLIGTPALARRSTSLLVRAASGQAGVDDGDAAGVLEHVAVDVAETGHVDRQLGPQHAWRHLGHLARGALLLLATGAIGHQTIVWCRGLRRRRLGLPASRPVEWGLYAAGWSLGWLLLWSTRPLDAPRGARPAVAVVIPARDEELALAHLLAPLRPTAAAR